MALVSDNLSSSTLDNTIVSSSAPTSKIPPGKVTKIALAGLTGRHDGREQFQGMGKAVVRRAA